MPERIGPALLFDDVLIDACRYNAGRGTAYAAYFAQDLAAAWPELTERCRRQIRQDVSRMLERDDFAQQLIREGKMSPAATGPLSATHRAAWEMVQAAWLRMAG